MIARLRRPITITLALGITVLAAACGSAGATGTPAAHTSTVSAAGWAHRADTI